MANRREYITLKHSFPTGAWSTVADLAGVPESPFGWI